MILLLLSKVTVEHSQMSLQDGLQMVLLSEGTDSLCMLLSPKPSKRTQCDGVWEGMAEEGRWRVVTMIKDLF